MLKFSKSNEKLEVLKQITKKPIYSFSLLSGWTCPGAKDCLAKVYEINGKRFLKDGKETLFRCFSASQEALYTNVYKSRKYNTEVVQKTLKEKGTAGLVSLIDASLPKNAGIIRIHVAGDWFSSAYMLSWILVARQNPSIIFYSYTKSLSFWIRHKALIDETPNFILTASYGGREDHLIEKHNLRYTKVVYSTYEARKLKLPIDKGDKYAALPALRKKNFSLLVHGVQLKNSKASRAVSRLNGLGSYGKRHKKERISSVTSS